MDTTRGVCICIVCILASTTCTLARVCDVHTYIHIILDVLCILYYEY